MNFRFPKKSIGLIVALVVLCAGCTLYEEREPPMTQLQIREIQTRTFENRNLKAVMKEMLNVLQDDGYIVKNANLDLGMITAEKDIDIERPSDRFWGGTFEIRGPYGQRSQREYSWNKHAIIEMSANIGEFGTNTRIRVNFQRKIYDNNDRVVEVHPILDQSHYQDFFMKVHKGLFIQGENM